MNAKIEQLDMLNAQKEKLQAVYEYYVKKIGEKGGSYKTPRLSFLAGEVFGFSKTTLAKCLRKLVELDLLRKEGKRLATYTLPDESDEYLVSVGYIGGADVEVMPDTESYIVDEGGITDEFHIDQNAETETIDMDKLFESTGTKVSDTGQVTSKTPIKIETPDDIVSEVMGKVDAKLSVQFERWIDGLEGRLGCRIDELSKRIAEIDSTTKGG